MSSENSKSAMKLSPSRKRLLQRVGLGAAVVLVFMIGKFTVDALTYESTDDAQVAGRKETLSSRVGGMVADILVDENQNVHAGDILVKIEDRDFHHRVDEITAQLD